MNRTHDPALRSWVDYAKDPASDFPIQNLPFGVCSRANEPARAGVAIGDQILDITALDVAVFPGESGRIAALCAEGTLNGVMARSEAERSAFRARVSELLSSRS